MVSSNKYEHYVKLPCKRSFVFLYSHTVGGVFKDSFRDPDDPTMAILQLGDTQEEMDYLDERYFRYTEDEDFFHIPMEDIIVLGARPRTKK